MLQDIRQALRSLTQRPASAGLTVVVFALAIGANTTVFSAFDGFLLRPMPFPDDRLVMIYASMPKAGVDDAGTSAAGYLDWRTAAALDAAAVFTQSHRTLPGEQPTRQISVTRASPSLWSVLGVSPSLGRGFTEDEAVAGNDLVVLLSHRLWIARFGGRPDVVGQSLELDDDRYRIVGVMPEGFGFPDRDTEAWVPFAYSFAQASDERFEGYVHGIGRLRAGATLQGLNAELDAIARSTIKAPRPAAFLEATGYTIRAEGLRSYVIGDLAYRLLVLQGLVLAVLLIACANVANLRLTQLTARRKELAVRAMLGAGIRRLARLLVLENVLLGFAGACLGLALAYGGIRIVRVLGLERASDGFELRLDAPVVIVTAGAALLAALVSVLLPVYELAREDFAHAVRASGGAGIDGLATRRWRNALVVVQLALGVTLLVGAGLLTKTFFALQAQGPGFEPAGLWSAGVELPRTRYADDASRSRFFEQALSELRSLPGVGSVGFATMLPFTSTDYGATVVVDGREPLDSGVPQVAQLHSIDEGYLPALGIPVILGRNFAHDEPERVAIVDESFARTYWPDGNALGQRLRNGADGSKDWYTIVGVVPHVKHDTFTHDEFENTVYWHYLQRAAPPMTGMFVLRSALPTQSLTSAAEAAIARVDPGVALKDVAPMDQRVRNALGPQRTPMVLTLAFAAIAVTLAVIGVYGVLSWAVARRVGEIGVRKALGAQAADVLRMVMKQGARMIVAGLVLGVGGALAVGRVLAALVPEVSSADPVVLLSAALVLTSSALLASWLPARRAMKVDPMEALRHD